MPADLGERGCRRRCWVARDDQAGRPALIGGARDVAGRRRDFSTGTDSPVRSDWSIGGGALVDDAVGGRMVSPGRTTKRSPTWRWSIATRPLVRRPAARTRDVLGAEVRGGHLQGGAGAASWRGPRSSGRRGRRRCTAAGDLEVDGRHVRRRGGPAAPNWRSGCWNGMPHRRVRPAPRKNSGGHRSSRQAASVPTPIEGVHGGGAVAEATARRRVWNGQRCPRTPRA